MSDPADQVGAGLVNADAAVQAANGDVWTLAAGGTWDTASGWSAAAPTASGVATLSNDFGTLTASYTVTVNSTDAVADTLTVGNATSAAVLPVVQLAIAAGGSLDIASGASVVQDGTLSVAGQRNTDHRRHYPAHPGERGADARRRRRDDDAGAGAAD